MIGRRCNGILFVLHTGIPWEDLPKELGFGSGMTCWRRLRDWQANGVLERLHLALLKRLGPRDCMRNRLDMHQWHAALVFYICTVDI